MTMMEIHGCHWRSRMRYPGGIDVAYELMTSSCYPCLRPPSSAILVAVTVQSRSNVLRDGQMEDFPYCRHLQIRMVIQNLKMLSTVCGIILLDIFSSQCSDRHPLATSDLIIADYIHRSFPDSNWSAVSSFHVGVDMGSSRVRKSPMATGRGIVALSKQSKLLYPVSFVVYCHEKIVSRSSGTMVFKNI